MTLTDTLDDLISDRRIEPQLALKIIAHFDKAVSDVLSEKLKNKMSFKVSTYANTECMRVSNSLGRFRAI